MSKKRLDIILVEKGLAPTRAKALAMVLAGEVYIGDRKIDKAGQLVGDDAVLSVKKSRPDFVSRGGVKLAHALDEFKLDVTGFICVDIGASTGGFTDCLLKKGAKKVYAIDVGYGQLDYALRNDDRVVVYEKTNIRDFDIKKITDGVDLVVIDVSFIGLEKVFPKVHELLACHCERSPEPYGSGRSEAIQSTRLLRRSAPRNDNAIIIALIKPQFQVGKGKVGKGGIVRDEGLRAEAVESVKEAAGELNWKFLGITESPIKGAKGNIEYLACWSFLSACSARPRML